MNIRFGFQLLNVAQQVSTGQADAAPIPEPFASVGEQQFGLQELADVDQGVTTNFPLEGYAVSQAWAPSDHEDDRLSQPAAGVRPTSNQSVFSLGP